MKLYHKSIHFISSFFVGNRFSNAVISVGESLRSLKTCGTFKGPGKKGQRIEINCGKGIKGRFVQVQLRGRGLIHLGEVQVFGASSGPVAPSGGKFLVYSDICSY